MAAEEYSDVVAAMMQERLGGDSVLNTTLKIGGRIYDTVIPQADTEAERAATYPCVVFAIDSAGAVLAGSSESIVWQPDDYAVFGITEGADFTALTSIAARLRQLLHGFNHQIIANGGYINWCRYRKLYKLALTESESGLRFVRLGGIFRIAARLAP